ncbi:DUF6139 family protein [Acidovorax sp. BL-A-41-H1]|uniref:DUF6139 family protein n=1 Tax=Acidovorax sp. BL-A-41-H1 TaxID=3421102 RepID=UPI003F7A709D
MLVDIYRRPENGGKFSHLAVPEGQPIPEEATNTDWVGEAAGTELDEALERWDEYGIERPGEQLQRKGYAITSVDQTTPG